MNIDSYAYILLFAGTENWKHCSKIIFKCVNSTMRPVNNAWTVHFISYTMNPCNITIHALKKKKKKKQTCRGSKYSHGIKNPNGFHQYPLEFWIPPQSYKLPLKFVIETVTESPIIYSWHQICHGITKFVTELKVTANILQNYLNY